MITAIDHVQLAMPAGREPEALAFYAGLLDMQAIEKPEPLRARGGCWFRSGTVDLHLGVEPDFRPARKAHPALLVDDLDALVRRLTAAGIVPVPDDALEGYVRVCVADPFGNRIELMQRLG